MKLKKTLFMMLIAVVSIFGMVSVSAMTISENGKYSLVMTVDGTDFDAVIDDEYAKIVRFDVADGEATVKLSELTKGITPFNGINEFSHWVNSDKVKVNDDLAISDFTSSGNFYKSNGEEVTYSNGLILTAKFEGKSLNDGDNYYVSIDAFGGKVNEKSKILLKSKSSEFTKIDLKKYVPVRKGCTFVGWDVNGKFVTSIDSSYFTKGALVNVTATYTNNTFDGDDRVLVLNANGGTISGKTSNKYDYLSGGDSGTSMSLLPYVPVRSGYTFTGWNSKKDGSGKNYTYIYWRSWDKDSSDDLEKDTMIKNVNGAEYYQNVTLYATWKKNSEESSEGVKEITSSSNVKGSITFDDEVSDDYVLDIKSINVSKKLSDKGVKFVADINVLENGQVVEINNIKMKIKIALPESLKGYNKYEVVYILNDEIKETILAKIENGYIVFETTHLSKYGIIAKSTNVENPDTADNILISFATLFISVVGMSSCFILKKRFN